MSELPNWAVESNRALAGQTRPALDGLDGLGDQVSVDLLFQLPAPKDGMLVFGAEANQQSHELKIRAQLPALTADLRLRSSVAFSLGASRGVALPGLTLHSALSYLSNTQRPTVAQTSTTWQMGSLAPENRTLSQQNCAQKPLGWSLGWQSCQGLDQGLQHHLPKLMRSRMQQGFFRFQDGLQRQNSGHLVSQNGLHLERTRVFGFDAAVAYRCAVGFRHQDCDTRPRLPMTSSWQLARRLMQMQATAFQCADPFAKELSAHYQEALVPAPGLSRWRPQVPLPPSKCLHGPYSPSGSLWLSSKHPATSGLLFLCEYHDDTASADVKPVVVAIRKVYVVINDVHLQRASNGQSVPVFGLSLSLDAASWAWGFEAHLPHSAQDLLEPDDSGPIELLATVNGTTFAVLAENISRERSFGQTSLRLTGRGKNALLAAPFAPETTFTNTHARTARQLMDDVLSINGVSMGWSVDWGLTDWNVPAGVFCHQGTWIEALSAIAGAAGGYLLPHPRDQTIRVRHRYPVAPWQWGEVTPDFVLPVQAIEKESIRWLGKRSYNRVFVSGVDAGVLAQVTRAGTAGDSLAPMVVDALITEATVARQRGLAILGDTGRQIEVSLNLPVLLETGIIEPGAFVQYRDAGVDRIGLVRSTQVQAGFPEVWQTLGVQTYA